MKLNGQSVSNTNIEHVVIPRKGQPDIVFVAKPVLNYDEFEALYPEPKPPLIQYPAATGKLPENDFTDDNYRLRLRDFCECRYYWMFLTSLKDSPGITWDTVDMLLPGTYKNYEKELLDAQFLPAEINKITAAVSIVNVLDERQMEEARKAFLAIQQDQ